MAKSFSKSNIIACKKASTGTNLIGVTEGGGERNLGGYGSPIASIVNTGDHAIIILENGGEYMYTFATGSDRKIR